MDQKNGSSNTQRFGEILVSKLKDSCYLVKDLMTKAERGEELTQHELEVLVSWLPALGELGEKELHVVLANIKTYNKDHLQKMIDAWKSRKDRFITCAEVKERGLCKNGCSTQENLGNEATPILLFIDQPILSGIFDSIKDHENYVIFTARGDLTFKVIQSLISNNSVYSKVELIMENELVYSDSLNLSSGKSRKQFANRCVEMRARRGIAGIDVEKCLMAMEGIVRKKIQNTPRHPDSDNKQPVITQQEREEAMAFLMVPNPLKIVENDVKSLGYIGEEPNVDLIYLICMSRKLAKPLGCVIRASSSAGKNALVGAVLELIPEEEKLVLSRVTQNALFYCAEQGLEHKVICIAERAGSEDADYSIRTLISEGKLAVFVPMKNEETGIIETQLIEVRGPVAYIETTAGSKLNIENLTRLFSVYIDESEEQTLLVHQIQRYEKTLEGLTASAERERIRKKHQNAQRLLEAVIVVIPFAPLITFPTHSVRSRRDHEKFLGLIMTIAFLRQFQKTKKYVNDVAYIEADITDYEIAFELSRTILHQTMDEISRKSRELMVIIRNMVQGWFDDREGELLDEKLGRLLTNLVFTRADVRRYTKGWSDASIHACMKELGYYELLRVAQGGRQGQTYRYTLLSDDETINQTFNKLLTPAELETKLDALTSQAVSEKS